MLRRRLRALAVLAILLITPGVAAEQASNPPVPANLPSISPTATAGPQLTPSALAAMVREGEAQMTHAISAAFGAAGGLQGAVTVRWEKTCAAAVGDCWCYWEIEANGCQALKCHTECA